MFTLHEKTGPLSRETQLELAREDLRFAHDNGVKFEDLATRINKGLGIQWDKSAARRFILGSEIVGSHRATKLSFEQVGMLRSISKQLRLDIEGALGGRLFPSIEKDFSRSVLPLQLNVHQAKLLEENPKLNLILQNALEITTHQIFEAYELGRNSDHLLKPNEP